MLMPLFAVFMCKLQGPMLSSAVAISSSPPEKNREVGPGLGGGVSLIDEELRLGRHLATHQMFLGISSEILSHIQHFCEKPIRDRVCFCATLSCSCRALQDSEQQLRFQASLARNLHDTSLSNKELTNLGHCDSCGL